MNTNEIIEKLKGLDLSKYPFNEVQALINEFDSLKVVRLNLKPNTLITRVRRGRGYSKRKDVSYPPKEFCKSVNELLCQDKLCFMEHCLILMLLL